ncbi:hypothetical protein PQO01_15370 [Lentisphaera marina]|uniref:chalcone isomerase family protein n=1 Tax=Lentisphaera marina TaxID=1111041 RepID=UPI002366F8BC|nr:chalcone isomerase family protein [Lentisphaera marina]MDD7986328.1 hypothetical protein [Lentisphaera marina]
MNKFILFSFCSLLVLANDHPDFSRFDVYKDKTFKFLFFKVYDLKILTPDKGKVDYKKAHVFHYTYHRDIDCQDLLESTLEEWERLQLCKEEHAIKWAEQLKKIWPDIQKGETLTAYFDGVSTSYYHQGKYLGEIKGTIFARTFFNIWLDPNSRMTELHED